MTTYDDEREPTLAALCAASASVRAACHAGYSAPAWARTRLRPAPERPQPAQRHARRRRQQHDAAAGQLDVGLTVDDEDLAQVALEVGAELRPALPGVGVA